MDIGGADGSTVDIGGADGSTVDIGGLEGSTVVSDLRVLGAEGREESVVAG